MRLLGRPGGFDYITAMGADFRQIAVDPETADLLEQRAAARGVSVSRLVADLVVAEAALSADIAAIREAGEGPWSPEMLEDDMRRSTAFEQSRLGVPWNEMESWLRSWGSPEERPPPKPRKL